MTAILQLPPGLFWRAGASQQKLHVAARIWLMVNHKNDTNKNRPEYIAVHRTVNAMAHFAQSGRMKQFLSYHNQFIPSRHPEPQDPPQLPCRHRGKPPTRDRDLQPFWASREPLLVVWMLWVGMTRRFQSYEAHGGVCVGLADRRQWY